jgi:hypothetical protein
MRAFQIVDRRHNVVNNKNQLFLLLCHGIYQLPEAKHEHLHQTLQLASDSIQGELRGCTMSLLPPGL